MQFVTLLVIGALIAACAEATLGISTRVAGDDVCLTLACCQRQYSESLAIPNWCVTGVALDASGQGCSVLTRCDSVRERCDAEQQRCIAVGPAAPVVTVAGSQTCRDDVDCQPLDASALFCSDAYTCHGQLGCTASARCPAGSVCSEQRRTCITEVEACGRPCNDGRACSGKRACLPTGTAGGFACFTTEPPPPSCHDSKEATLASSSVGAAVACVDDMGCDNGIWCDGTETCLVALGQVCITGARPCAEACNESARTCAPYVPVLFIVMVVILGALFAIGVTVTLCFIFCRCEKQRKRTGATATFVAPIEARYNAYEASPLEPLYRKRMDGYSSFASKFA